MAGDAQDKKKKKKGGGRTTAMAGLLAVVAVIGAWLSNCIPGFGIGADGSADGEAQEQADTPAEPAQPEAAKPEAPEADKAEGGAEAGAAEAGAAGDQAEAAADTPEVAAGGPLMITVDARGCTVGAGPEAKPEDCTALCNAPERFEGVESIKLDTTEGPHKTVVTLLDCLRETKIPVAVTRDE